MRVCVTFYCINLDARLVMYQRQHSIWTWICSTSAAPSSLFHDPNGFAYYVAQDTRQMSREQKRETVYSPVCKAKGAPVNYAGRAEKSDV